MPKKMAQDAVRDLVSPPCGGFARAFFFSIPLSYSRKSRWPVIKGRQQADSNLVLESEGSAQLGTAGLLSESL